MSRATSTPFARLRSLLAAGALLALLLGCAPREDAGTDATAGRSSPPLNVFAAASLKESMDAAAEAFRAETGQTVQVSYAASSALARQIDQGAPADAFVSADLEWMDWLQARDLIDIASRRDLLGNTLVLVAPASGDTAPVELTPGVDLVARLQGGRLALALTESVPAGKYAKASLEALGLWTSVAPHVAEADNVRATLMLVARGEAPLGAVYGSDAQAEPAVRVVGTFPEGSHDPIVYPIARLARSAHPGTEAFLAWLGTEPAQAIFVERGFTLR